MEGPGVYASAFFFGGIGIVGLVVVGNLDPASSAG